MTVTDTRDGIQMDVTYCVVIPKGSHTLASIGATLTAAQANGPVAIIAALKNLGALDTASTIYANYGVDIAEVTVDQTINPVTP